MQKTSRPYWARSRLLHLTLCVLLGYVAAFAAPAAAAPTEKLILGFGDSLMAGYRLKANESFPAQLEAALRAKGHKVRVHNAGVSGDTTVAGRARLAWVLAGLKQKPDLAILELGGNDMLRGFPPATTKANLDAMLGEFRRRGIPVILAGMLGGPNLGVRYVDEFNALYPALARKHGASFYPFFVKGVAFNPPLLLDDGIHPNRQGVAVMVRNILPSVSKSLEALPPAVK